MNTTTSAETYHISMQSPFSFNETIEKITENLREEGFGVITTIDLKETFKKKLNVDFRRYTILGACNPRFAYESLLEEDKVGVFLPCNVVIQEHDDGKVEVSVIDPEEMVRPTGNLNLRGFATQVKQSIKQVLRKLDG